MKMKNMYSLQFSKILLLVLFGIFHFCIVGPGYGGGQDIGGVGGDILGEALATETEIIRALQNFHEHRIELIRGVAVGGILANRLLRVSARTPESAFKAPSSEVLNQFEVFSSLFLKNSEVVQNIYLDAHPLTDVKTYDLKTQASWLLSGDGIFNELRTNLELRTNSPCFNEFGVESEGSSAVQNGKRIICINVAKLKTALTLGHYELDLLGLYVHELAHHMGGNELEARKLQRIFSGIGPNFSKFFSFLKGSQKDVESEVQALKGLHLQILNKVLLNGIPNGASASRAAAPVDAQICQDLNSFYQRAQNIFVKFNVETYGLVSLALIQIRNLHILWVMAGYNRDYCENGSSPQVWLHQLKFKGQTRSSMKALYPDPLGLLPAIIPDSVEFYSQYLWADLWDGSFNIVQPSNLESLRDNLKIMDLLF